MGESMEITAQTYTLNILLAFVPDLIVAWIAASLTDSGWSGFLITLIVLQAIYFFFWAKQALWSWLLFWLYSKDQMARGFELFFAESVGIAGTSSGSAGLVLLQSGQGARRRHRNHGSRFLRLYGQFDGGLQPIDHKGLPKSRAVPECFG
jgi:hypothetical protein